MQRYFKKVTDAQGNIKPGAIVAVYVYPASGNQLAQLYGADDDEVPKANPFQADASAIATFFADDGDYELVATDPLSSDIVGRDIFQLLDKDHLLRKDENLGDLEDAAEARDNLGLGSAALQPAEAFEPAGAASGALQQAENLGDLVDVGEARTNLGLGSAAVAAVEDFDEAGAAAEAVADHELAADPHAQYQKESEKGQANGYAPLGADAKVPSAHLPPLALTDVFVVNSQAAQLALVAEEGDVVVRTDAHGNPAGPRSYIHNGGSAGTMADWTELQSPLDAVLSVDGRTGAVSLADLYDALGAAAAAQAAAIGASLQKAQNLADLPDAGVARGNLGLGTAATQNVGAFDPAGSAAAAQAAAQASSLQKAANLGDLASAAAARQNLGVLVTVGIACSDESTALTAGNGKVTFRMPHALTLLAGAAGVRASLVTAQGAGAAFTVDINEAGGSILSTKLTIDNGSKTSVGAATPPVISDVNLADDAEITVDIDQIGDGTAKGLKIWLRGYMP